MNIKIHKLICFFISVLTLCSCSNQKDIILWDENVKPNDLPKENITLKSDFKLHDAIKCTQTFLIKLNNVGGVEDKNVNLLYYFGEYDGYKFCFIDYDTVKVDDYWDKKEVICSDTIGDYTFEWWDINKKHYYWRPRLYKNDEFLTIIETYKKKILTNKDVKDIYDKWNNNRNDLKLGIRFNQSYSKISKIEVEL